MKPDNNRTDGTDTTHRTDLFATLPPAPAQPLALVSVASLWAALLSFCLVSCVCASAEEWAPSGSAGAFPVASSSAADSQVPDGDFLKNTMLAGSFLANFFLAMRAFRGGGEKREIVNDPLTVKAHTEFASREEHNELRGELMTEFKTVYGRIESTRSDILSAGARREEKLQDQLQKITQLVGELRGQISEISKRK